MITYICLSLSDLLHLVWQSLGPSMLRQMALFCSFLWLSNIPLYICTTSSLIIPLLIKWLFFHLLNDLDTFVENQLTINVRVYFWILNSISLIYLFIFRLAVLSYHRFVVSFEIWIVSPPTLFFFKVILLFWVFAFLYESAFQFLQKRTVEI